MTVIYAVIALAIIVFDQLAKLWTVNSGSFGGKFGEIPYIADLVYVKNTGAAFSMFSGKVEILGVISVMFCIGVIVYWILKKPKHPLLCTAVSAMFSGALGNAIDRITRGFVVDYIDVKFMDFPVFNIADIAICVGGVLLVLYVMFFDKGKTENE